MEPSLLRVDMSKLEVKYEPVPEKYRHLGGRGLTSAIVADEVPPEAHPLGKNNKVVIAPGIVSGTSAPSSGRVSVGGKSPLTGGIKEANAGSKTSQYLAKLGIKAVIIEGQPKDRDNYYLLRVDKEGAELQEANQWSGKGLYEAFNGLYREFGDAVGICGVGKSAEMLMANSGVCFNDLEGRPSRYAGRGGLGAVMASKGLKFIVVDGKEAPGVKMADKEKFKEGKKKLVEALQTHDVTKLGGALNSYGTAVLINIMNEAGGLPTRNFSSGRFEGAAKVSGEALAEGVKKRGGAGKTGHPCHPGCIIRCSNIWPKENGEELVSVQEYESIWAFGPNCGIDSLDVTGELIKICNDIGLDTIEAGNTIAVAMEGGLAEFGDGEKAIELLKEIDKGTALGKILGNGAAFTGKALGVTRVPVVKGQAMPAYEPRAVKGIGVTYATSTMGADHTSGYTIATEILNVGGKADPFEPTKAELSRNFQASTAFIDSTGYCLFTAFAIIDIPEGFEGMVETCNGVLGTEWSVDDAVSLGQDIVKMERKFNEAAGFTSAHDRLPEFMKFEPLPPHNTVFDVPDEELDKVHKYE